MAESLPNDTEFQWTGARKKAAVLVAHDILSDAEIAASVGVTKNTLERWKRAPQFVIRVDAEKDRLVAEVRAEGVAHKQNRIDSYVSDFDLISQIMAERAADPEIAEGPGGKTGLIARTIKPLGSGDNFTTVAEFAFDAALLTARQNLRKQIAQERGEWTEKRDVSHEGDLTIRVVYGEDNHARTT